MKATGRVGGSFTLWTTEQMRYPPMTRLALASSASTALLLSACAPVEDAEPEALFVSSSAIQGGYLDDVDTHVVGLAHYGQAGAGTCTGTLIAPNVVLSAQHCVAATVEDDLGVQCGVTGFGGLITGQNFVVTTKVNFTFNLNDYHDIQEILVPPDTEGFCGNDMALIILTEPVAVEEAVPAIPRIDEEVAMSEEYYAVGFGAQSDSEGADSGTRYRLDDLSVLCSGSACNSTQVDSKEWRGETGVCVGDSGGPAFDSLDRLIGVASRGSAGCSTPIYGGVFGWSDWLKEVVVGATETAGIDVPLWAQGWPTNPVYRYPIGAECAEPQDCSSNACLDGYCTRLCLDVAPCPEGYECVEEGYCKALPPPPSSDDEGATEVSACSVSETGHGSDDWALWFCAIVGLARLCSKRA